MRADLAGRLVDVLSLPVEQVNENERVFTADILVQLFDHLPLEVRAELSARISVVLCPPTLFLRRMLLDDISVAAPLIDNLTDIPDTLLMEAATMSPQHRARISRRMRLNDHLVETIIAQGDIEATLLLLKRDDVTISKQCIEDLVLQTEHNIALRSPLLERWELTPINGFAMFWWLDASGRRRVLTRYAMDRRVIQEALADLYSEVFSQEQGDPVVKGILKLCDRRHRARGLQGETLSVEVAQKTLAACLANPNNETATAAGFIAGVSHETSRRILTDMGGEAFAVMCKAVGISRSNFADLLSKVPMFRTPQSIGPSFTLQDNERILAVFDMTARDYSRTILRYWDWQNNLKASASL